MANTKHGVRIKIYEAKSIYEYNLGITNEYSTKKSSIKNSLLLDFLKDNGLKIDGSSTNDLICINFEQNSRSYEQEIENWKYLIEHKNNKKNPKIIYNEEAIDFFKKRLLNAELKKDLFEPKTKEEIREMFYQNGVDIAYNKYNKKGEIISTKVIHYIYLYRSTGMAKAGKAIFINEKLYKKTLNFIQMGIKLPKGKAKIVENSAYRALVSSAIVGRVKIDPKNILVLKDIDSFFNTNVILVGSDEDKKTFVERKDNYKLKNTLFDGQGLIESSLVSEYHGFVLLRHHYCKMACFKSNIQLFFKEYYGDEYDTAIIKDMWGNEHYAKDIQLITTDNAMKWLKLGATYEQWCEKVYDNNCQFGIVKDAHPSKMGKVQKMSYQMINCLDPNIMDKVVQCSLDYVEQLKTNDNVFLDYLDLMKNFSNDYEVLRAIALNNSEFIKSEYFRERRWKIIETYTSNLRKGKAIQNADNLVIVGNPYGMLMYSVGEDPFTDPTFEKEEGCIQVWTSRFNDGEYLAEFRNPFNSANNLGYIHNCYHMYFDRYFDFCDNIISVNMVETDFQDRNNGSDMDSDMVYVTNQEEIVGFAKKAYKDYPTIVNIIKPDTTEYDNTPLGYSQVDNKTSASQEDIGYSSNVAQISQSYSYTFPNEQIYKDCTCILAVLAQVAVDSSKRVFWVDTTKEIKRISNMINIKANGYPKFWKSIQDTKRKKIGMKPFDTNKINENLICSMNYLNDIKIKRFRSNEKTLPMDYFFQKFELETNRRQSKKVEELIEKYSLMKQDYIKDGIEDYEDYDILLREDYEQLINDIKRVYISSNYIGLMSWLIDRAFCITPQSKGKIGITNSNTNENRALLLKVLYDINPNNIIKIFSKKH